MLYNVLLVLKDFPTGIQLTELAKKTFDKEFKGTTERNFNTHYMRLYRLVRQMPNTFEPTKIAGCWWVTPTKAAFDLIKAHVKFKLCKMPDSILPKRSHKLRRESIIELLQLPSLGGLAREKLKENFEAYIEEIDSKFCILERVKYSESIPPFMALKYTTRFNSEKKKISQLERFEYALDKATKENKVAIFLTLTTDPKRFTSVYHANRHLSKALNRFFSFLTKRIGHRPKYIANYEYTKKTGLIHTHMIIFGVRHLLSHRKITDQWEKCNQGSVNWIYSLRNRNGTWQWKKRRPKAAKTKDAGEYLKKYIKKCLFDNEEQECYWVFNKRYFTCSRSYNPPPDEISSQVPTWAFLGAFSLWDLPQFTYKVTGLSKLMEGYI